MFMKSKFIPIGRRAKVEEELCQAIVRNNLAEISRYIDDYGIDRVYDKHTALSLAVKEGNTEVVRSLLSKGANVDGGGIDVIALAEGKDEIKRYLLTENLCGIINKAEQRIREQEVVRLRSILKSLVNEQYRYQVVNSKSLVDGGEIPLIMAIQVNYPEAASVLVDYADVMIGDREGRLPWSLAAQQDGEYTKLFEATAERFVAHKYDETKLMRLRDFATFLQQQQQSHMLKKMWLQIAGNQNNEIEIGEMRARLLLSLAPALITVDNAFVEGIANLEQIKQILSDYIGDGWDANNTANYFRDAVEERLQRLGGLGSWNQELVCQFQEGFTRFSAALLAEKEYAEPLYEVCRLLLDNNLTIKMLDKGRYYIQFMGVNELWNLGGDIRSMESLELLVLKMMEMSREEGRYNSLASYYPFLRVESGDEQLPAYVNQELVVSNIAHSTALFALKDDDKMVKLGNCRLGFLQIKKVAEDSAGPDEVWLLLQKRDIFGRVLVQSINHNMRLVTQNFSRVFDYQAMFGVGGYERDNAQHEERLNEEARELLISDQDRRESLLRDHDIMELKDQIINPNNIIYYRELTIGLDCRSKLLNKLGSTDIENVLEGSIGISATRELWLKRLWVDNPVPYLDLFRRRAHNTAENQVYVMYNFEQLRVRFRQLQDSLEQMNIASATGLESLLDGLREEMYQELEYLQMEGQKVGTEIARQSQVLEGISVSQNRGISEAIVQDIMRHSQEKTEAISDLWRRISDMEVSQGDIVTRFNKKIAKLEQLEVLIDDIEPFRRLVEQQHAQDQRDARCEEIFQDSYGRSFYRYFMLKMNAAYMAAAVIKSNMVPIGQKGLMGSVGDAFNIVSNSLPVAGSAVQMIGAILTKLDEKYQTQMISHLFKIAISVEEMNQLAQQIVLKLLPHDSTELHIFSNRIARISQSRFSKLMEKAMASIGASPTDEDPGKRDASRVVAFIIDKIFGGEFIDLERLTASEVKAERIKAAIEINYDIVQSKELNIAYAIIEAANVGNLPAKHPAREDAFAQRLAGVLIDRYRSLLEIIEMEGNQVAQGSTSIVIHMVSELNKKNVFKESTVKGERLFGISKDFEERSDSFMQNSVEKALIAVSQRLVQPVRFMTYVYDNPLLNQRGFSTMLSNAYRVGGTTAVNQLIDWGAEAPIAISNSMEKYSFVAALTDNDNKQAVRAII